MIYNHYNSKINIQSNMATLPSLAKRNIPTMKTHAVQLLKTLVLKEMRKTRLESRYDENILIITAYKNVKKTSLIKVMSFYTSTQKNYEQNIEKIF